MLSPNYDPRPLRVRVRELMDKRKPEWMTVQEMAAILGDWQPTVSSVVSKWNSYSKDLEMRRENGKVWWRVRG